MKRALIIAILLLAALVAGWLVLSVPTDGKLCRDKISSLKEGETAKRLETWANENVFSRSMTVQNVQRTRSYAGAMWAFVDASIPWQKFGFISERNLQVRLVGPSEEWDMAEKPDAYSSILLTQMNRNAVLVKKPDAAEFGIGARAEHLTLITESVAVLCLPGRD